MTATNIGLPDSAVVDPRGNLTPEWLHALGRLEALHVLRERVEGLGDLQLQEFIEETDQAQDDLTAMLEGITANIAIFSEISLADASPVNTKGVYHGLGTDEYIALLGKPNPFYDTNQFPIMAVKDADRWTSDYALEVTFFVSVTFNALER